MRRLDVLGANPRGRARPSGQSRRTSNICRCESFTGQTGGESRKVELTHIKLPEVKVQVLSLDLAENTINKDAANVNGMHSQIWWVSDNLCVSLSLN